MTHEPNCPCDQFIHPAPLLIDAGLSTIPRQIATFAEFRHAMLAELPSKPALVGWRARGDQDLGVMLVEMWSYVCDAVSFYDETIAHEAYLRTARLTPSVRKLVAVLGYRPRPAVAARARLAVKAEGRQPIVLPARTAFRSSAFGASPPQVFELDADTRVHPLLNGWSVAAERPASIPAGLAAVLLAQSTARVKPDDSLLLVSGSATPQLFTAMSVETVTGSDGVRYRKVALDRPLPAAVLLASARLLRPNGSSALWSNASDTSYGLAKNVDWLFLAGVVPQIRSGSQIIARGPYGRAAFKVLLVTQASRQLAPGSTITHGTAPNATVVTTPAVKVPVTLLVLDDNWPDFMGFNAGQITIEYDLQEAGAITAEIPSRIQPGTSLRLLPPVEAPPDGSQPGRFLVSDADATGMEIGGGVDFATRTLSLAQGTVLAGPLDPPAIVQANVADVSRGETVPNEVLGLGDGSIPNQTFKLKKQPLTYLTTPTGADPSGVTNTLHVRVRDIEWAEVPSFFDIPADATVYIVRQNDAEESSVVFGDGIRGARLPSGALVVASYRYGAGAASPPAGGITQLAKPVKGVTSITSPLPASGGADAQPASQVRSYAPRSALLFGRAVSIRDMEALAAGQAGVRAVHAEWAWDGQMQLPAIFLWYIGSEGIAAAVAASLRGATAPSTPIQAQRATPVPATLVVDLVFDRRHQGSVVRDAVAKRLTADGTGLLSADRIGIGTPLYRSRILAEVLAVDGVTGVRGLVWQDQPFEDFATAAGTGAWFEVAVTINVTEDPDA
jgi:hypothetical protein